MSTPSVGKFFLETCVICMAWVKQNRDGTRLAFNEYFENLSLEERKVNSEYIFLVLCSDQLILEVGRPFHGEASSCTRLVYLCNELLAFCTVIVI